MLKNTGKEVKEAAGKPETVIRLCYLFPAIKALDLEFKTLSIIKFEDFCINSVKSIMD